MANRNQEANKFFRGAYKLMSEAAAKGYGDVRPYVVEFRTGDIPYLTDAEIKNRKDLYFEHLHTLLISAFTNEDKEFMDRINTFAKASKSRTCRKPKNV